MPTLWNSAFTREELLSRVGSMDQVGGARRLRWEEGPEDAMLAAEMRTGSGLNLWITPTRGLDVAHAEYNGIPLAWRSRTGDVHSAYFEPPGLGWLRGFFGGLITTCGLTYLGAAGPDREEDLGIHGRISYTAARNVLVDNDWDGDDYVMRVQGKLTESAVFGNTLVLTRRITARLGEPRFFVHDSVENRGRERSPFMLLYHVNIGFPLVHRDSRLLLPTEHVTPRDEAAQVGHERYDRFEDPTPDYAERVYFHAMRPNSEGRVQAAIVNPGLRDGIGVYLRYDPRELPCFTEWKMMNSDEYVVGLEPGNCLPLGRAVERSEGRLRYLEPGEVQEFHLECGVLDGSQAIRSFEQAMRS
ncbi:MAG: aldose 1-epimerase family protein [Chloroflexi bacterium]|nr:aldose 1-epimerase family protein [Chloroflexota bacterium]